MKEETDAEKNIYSDFNKIAFFGALKLQLH